MSAHSTYGEWTARMASAPLTDAERLVGAGGLVVIAPHPDDETLGTSALLLEAARSRRRVGIVATTDGEGSHRNSASFPPARLAAVRAEEQRAAVAALGCDHAEWLRLSLPDGASGRDPRFEAQAEAVVEFCLELGATSIAAPHPDDPHPDHHAAARLAQIVRERIPTIRVLFYEIWSGRFEADQPFRHEGLTPFRVPTDRDAKERAIACHASQRGSVVADDPDGFVLPDWFLKAQEAPFERVSWAALPGTLPGPEHFERLYASDGDPWHVRSSPYEQAKRQASIDALAGRSFERSLEAGCGEGHLSAALLAAGIVRQAVGFDREPAIVERAAHMGWGPAIRFQVGSMPHALPEGLFDLVIFSEVLYFLDETALTALVGELGERLSTTAAILVVCYKGRTDTPLSGRDAADFFAASFGESVSSALVRETEDYRLELLERR